MNHAAWNSDGVRVNSVPTTSGKTIAEAAKLILRTRAATSEMSGLKHSKMRPESLEEQYEDELKQLYLKEWPDGVRKYQRKQPCCCCRDPERDEDTKELLQRILPFYAFYTLIFTGAISSGSKAFDYIINAFWHVFAVLHVLSTLLIISVFFLNLECMVSTNCKLMSTKLESTMMLGRCVTQASLAVATYLVPTSLRDQLRSREMHTLLSSIDPSRVGRPRWRW